MRQILFGAALVALTSLPAWAQNTTTSSALVVVELFTSQGCSSCPPADELINELASSTDVLPLSLHVDYWDYIGWKDKFAQAKFTTRQRAYAKAAGERSIYTPQMIVQGRDHVVGYKPMKLADFIKDRQAQAAKTPVNLALTKDTDSYTITLAPTNGLPKRMVVQFVRFSPHERVEIRRGENAGRVIDYANVVTEWLPVAKWDGAQPLTLTVPTQKGTRGAVILQTAGAGQILAAAAQ